MSTAIFEAKASGMAILNDALRGAFAIDGTTCCLLKRSEHSGAFTNLGELTSGYFVEFDENRSESGLFIYNTTDLDFADTWAQATHVGYGVLDSVGAIEIYEFAEGEKDTINPDGFSDAFSGRIVKVQNERYTI